MQRDDPAPLSPAPDPSRPVQPALGYPDGRSHLADEMRLLDRRVAARLAAAHAAHALAGLVVSEVDVDELMRRPGALDPPAGDVPGIDAQSAAFDASIVAATRTAAALGRYLPLPELALRCGLSRLEERVLVACLAPEIDARYDKVFGYLHDDVTQRRPSVGLTLALVCDDPAGILPARALFDEAAPLRRYRLIELGEPGMPLIARSLRLRPRIVDHLIGLPPRDTRIAPQRSFESQAVPVDTLERLRAFVRAHADPNYPAGLDAVVHLHGPPGTSAAELAGAVCSDLGVPLLVADMAAWLERPETFDDALAGLCLEALLLDAALCLQHADGLLAGARLAQVVHATAGRLTFVTALVPWPGACPLAGRWLADIAIPMPDAAQRARSWERQLSGSALAADVDPALLAADFRLTQGQIEAAADEARSRVAWESPSPGRLTLAGLRRACRAQSTPQLGHLARRIVPRRRWTDLVLPPDEMRQLREFCGRARLRDVVYGRWGFDAQLQLGKGLNALFCGKPGAGKTLAAEVAAAELGFDLYKIDLSQVVSKFIGETEKQLSQLFDEAQGSEAVLFFDEADALFGKRSEVKDAHDRYANIEIGYLLQRMEEYDGIAIMATNMRSSIDDAFVRRLQLILEFPAPQQTERERIWRAHLPPELPVASDLDIGFLAATFALSGGYIRNIVVAAAFLAAAENAPLGMRHALLAARREFQKMGRNCSVAEFGRYAHLLQEAA